MKEYYDVEMPVQDQSTLQDLQLALHTLFFIHQFHLSDVLYHKEIFLFLLEDADIFFEFQLHFNF